MEFRKVSLENPLGLPYHWERRRRYIDSGALPLKKDLIGAYLYRIMPSSSSIIDESGKGNNALLIGSNCVRFRTGASGYSAKSIMDFVSFDNPSDFKIRLGLRFATATGGQYIIFKGMVTGENKRSFTLYATNNLLRVYVYGTDGVTNEYVDLPRVNIGEEYRLSMHFLNGVLSYKLNDVEGSETFPTITEVYNQPLPLYFGSYAETTGTFNGDLWDVTFGNGHWRCAEGDLDMLYCQGGCDVQIIGGSTIQAWSDRQDSYHASFLEGYSEWTNGQYNVNVDRAITPAGLTLVADCPSGRWHNGAETCFQLPSVFSDTQELTPLSSDTLNSQLAWKNANLINATLFESGASTIYEENGLTVLDAPSGDLCYFYFPVTWGNDKIYKYYIEVEESDGAIQVSHGSSGLTPLLQGPGVFSGSLSGAAGVEYQLISIKNASGTLIKIKKFYFWEEGTVPPMCYIDFLTNINDKDRAFSNTSDKKRRKLVVYNRQLTQEEVEEVLDFVA
jgi:hypothetical protein